MGTHLGRKPGIFSSKNDSIKWHIEQTGYTKCITDGALGAEPPAAGDGDGLGGSPKTLGYFCDSLEKLAILTSSLDNVSHVFKAI